MLHAAILPQHPRWAHLFAHLAFIVVDELHTYTGLFGCNVANLFRRVDRLCRHYGSRPQFICSSATFANPLEVAGKLMGRVGPVGPVGAAPLTGPTGPTSPTGPTLRDPEMELISEDGSPRGERTFVLWNPPRIRSTTWRSRRSANVEAQELMTSLIRSGAPTITFSKAKVTAELIYRYVRESLQVAAPELANKVTPYRGGYLAPERREIEQRLFRGELLGVSSTRALELGIDVGGLEASILVGYPGTLAAFFQQAGRAGRRGKPSLVVLVGLDTAINQYVMQHPEYLFGRPIEEGVVEPDNPFVLLGHLRCAAYELPLGDDEIVVFGAHAPIVLDVLESQHKLHHDAARRLWYHSAPEVPQHEISLRAMDDKNVTITDASTEKVIGEMVKLDAPVYLHPQAIYLHQGETYLAEQLDLDRCLSRVRKVDVDYYTQPIGGTDVDHIDHRLRERPFGTGKICFGEVTTRFDTWGYERIHFYTLDAISRHPLDIPTFLFETQAFWLIPPEELCREVYAAGLDAHAGCRGIGYATRMVLPLFVRCETLDFSHSVGAVNAPWQATFIYERYPLGLGFTERAYEIAGRLMPAVLDMIRKCDCEDGCPCCVGKPLRQDVTWNVERGEGSIPSKKAALAILEGLLGDGTRLDEPDAEGNDECRMTNDESMPNDECQMARAEATPNAICQDASSGPNSSFVIRHSSLSRLAQALRRRLERHREPLLPHPIHPIEPEIETGFPRPEDRKTLSSADVARRVFRMLRHEKAIARGEKQPTPATPSPNVPQALKPPSTPSPDLGGLRPTGTTGPIRPMGPIDPAQGPAAVPPPIRAGDPLAALARKRRKKRDKGMGTRE